MKKIIIGILCILFPFAKNTAQNPTETVISVEYETEFGNDTIVNFSTINRGSFHFIGGEGKVDHILDGQIYNNESSYEDNIDVYSWYKEDYDKITIVVNLSQKFNKAGIIISEEPITEDVINNSEPINLNNSNNHSYTNLSNNELYPYNFYYTKEYIYGNEKPFSKVFNLSGLKYTTQYYYRPYVLLDDNKYMFGMEKTFTTPRTIEAACLYDSRLGNLSSYDKELKLCITNTAAIQILNSLGCSTDINSYQAFNLGKMFFSSLSMESIEQLLMKQDDFISCTDGNYKLLSSIPNNIMEEFLTAVTSPIYFFPEDYINYDLDSIGNCAYTKNSNFSVINCEQIYELPYNKYLSVIPTTSSANVSVGIDLPTILIPGEYKVNITFAPNIEDLDDKRPNRMYIYWIEKNIEGNDIGLFTGTGTRIANPDGSGSYFETKDGGQVDTISFNYSPIGFTEGLIQLQSQVTSKLTKTYDRNLRIASIQLQLIK